MAEPIPLPENCNGKDSCGWWGMLALIATEGSLFAYLLFSYFYLASQTEQHWPPEGLPALFVPAINTLVLLASSVCVWISERCIRRSQLRWSFITMLAGHLLGVCFIAIQLSEWRNKPYGIASNLYGSLYFTITGFHLVHVAVGVIILMALLIWIALGYFDRRRYAAISIGGLYWHFVDLIWVLVFISLYLTPYVY